MAHNDSGWRPKGRGMTYKGYGVWNYERGPHQINEGQVDPDPESEDDEE